MLKQVVTYTDFNDQPQTKELYFHISKARILDNLVLIEEFQNLANSLSGPERELSTEEKQNIIRLVKSFMKLSYGVRSADGQSFRQRDELPDRRAFCFIRSRAQVFVITPSTS